MPPPPPGPPVPLFPPAPTITLIDNNKLKNAVAAAVAAVVSAERDSPAAPFAVTLIDVSTNAVGGFNEDREYYAASIVKTGVIYAAHALLDMVRRYNALRSPSGLAREVGTVVAVSSVGPQRRGRRISGKWAPTTARISGQGRPNRHHGVASFDARFVFVLSGPSGDACEQHNQCGERQR